MGKVTNISKNCLQVIAHFECGGDITNPKWRKAYQDTGGVWTIGAGTIRYPNGKRVKQGDTCTLEQIYEYLNYDLHNAVEMVDAMTVDTVTQCQFDALVSFVYNIGTNGYKTSTLRSVINKSTTNYPAIITQFQKWKYDDGKEQPGLVRRRNSEAYLYCRGELKFYFTKNEIITP